MPTIIAPKGWRPDKIEHRFSTAAPSSYSATEHTAECIISAGATVNRIYGKETLVITKEAIDLSRIPVPLLDSHSQASVIDSVLGTINRAWVSGGNLYGQIRFAQTPRGKLAEGMVSRGEVAGISAGYSVSKWIVRDADGNLVDEDNVGWADDLTFTAIRWMLYEASLTGVPADMASAIRSAGGDHIIDCRERMTIRERMQIRQAMHDRQQAMNQRLQ